MNSAQMLQVLIALVFIVGLLLALAWIARRSGWIRQHITRADLRILGSLRLGARASVALIQVEDARLVVGITAQQVTLLHTLPAQGAGTAGAQDDPTGSAPGTGAATTGAHFAENLGKALLGKR